MPLVPDAVFSPETRPRTTPGDELRTGSKARNKNLAREREHPIPGSGPELCTAKPDFRTEPTRMPSLEDWIPGLVRRK